MEEEKTCIILAGRRAWLHALSIVFSIYSFFGILFTLLICNPDYIFLNVFFALLPACILGLFTGGTFFFEQDKLILECEGLRIITLYRQIEKREVFFNWKDLLEYGRTEFLPGKGGGEFLIFKFRKQKLTYQFSFSDKECDRYFYVDLIEKINSINQEHSLQIEKFDYTNKYVVKRQFVYLITAILLLLSGFGYLIYWLFWN